MRKSFLVTILALIAAMFFVTAPAVFATGTGNETADGNQNNSDWVEETVTGNGNDTFGTGEVNGGQEIVNDSTIIKDNKVDITDSFNTDNSTETTVIKDNTLNIIKDNTVNIDKSVTDIDVKKTEIKTGDIAPDNDVVDIEELKIKDSFNTTEVKTNVDVKTGDICPDNDLIDIEKVEINVKKTDIDVKKTDIDIKKTEVEIEDVKINSDNYYSDNDTNVNVDYDYTVIVPEDNRPQAMIVVDTYEGHLQTNDKQYNPSPFDARATSVHRTWSLAELEEGAKKVLKNRKVYNRDWIWKGVLPKDEKGNPVEKRDKDGNLIYLQAKSLNVYLLNSDGSLPANLASNLSLDKAGTIRLLNQDPKIMAEEVFALGGFICVNKGISNVGILPCNTYEAIDDLIAASGGVGISNTLNPYTMLSAALNGNAAREKTYVRVLSGWYMIPLIGEFGAGH